MQVFSLFRQQYKKDKAAIVGDDTDFLDLLLHYAPDSNDIWFQQAGKCDKHTKLKTVKARLGQFQNTILPFHAFAGCDTTDTTVDISTKYCAYFTRGMLIKRRFIKMVWKF